MPLSTTVLGTIISLPHSFRFTVFRAHADRLRGQVSLKHSSSLAKLSTEPYFSAKHATLHEFTMTGLLCAT